MATWTACATAMKTDAPFLKREGRLKCLRYLHENGCELSIDCTHEAACHYRWDCLSYLITKDCQFNVKFCLRKVLSMLPRTYKKDLPKYFAIIELLRDKCDLEHEEFNQECDDAIDFSSSNRDEVTVPWWFHVVDP